MGEKKQVSLSDKIKIDISILWFECRVVKLFLTEIWSNGKGIYVLNFFSWCQLLAVALDYWQWHILMVHLITVSEVINLN